MSLLDRVTELLSGSTPSPRAASVLRFGDYKLTDTVLIFPPEVERRPLKLRHLKMIAVFPDETPPVQVTCKTEQFWIDVGPAHVEFLRAVRTRAPWVMVGLENPDDKILHVWA